MKVNGPGPLQTAPPTDLLSVVDLGTVASAVVVLLVAYLLARLVTFGLEVIAERAGERRLTVKVFAPLTKFAIYGIAVASILGPVLQLSATQLLAVSGLFGAVLGFGLQGLFASLVGGLVVVFERPYRVGDKVSVGEHYGEVTDVGLRTTRLVTPDDTAVAVPNDAVFAESVANANDGAAEMQVVVDLPVALDADHERAATIVEEALVTSRYVRLSDEHDVTVLVRDESYRCVVRGKAYVADLRDEFRFQSDVTERARSAFEAHEIERPELGTVRVDEDTGVRSAESDRTE